MSSLERNPMGRWVWTDAHGVRHEQVIVVRAYPVTAPNRAWASWTPRATSWPGSTGSTR